MSTSKIFKKHFGDTASVDLKHSNMESFFEELNAECLAEDKRKKKKERFFALKRPFEHPYMTYEVGTNFTARMWSDKMGHGMEEKEFIKLAETDDRFKQYFKETTS